MTGSLNQNREGEATAEPLGRPKGGISRANCLPNLTVTPIHREGEATADPLGRPKGGISRANSLPNLTVIPIHREGEATAEPLGRQKGGISRANSLPNLTVTPIHREGEATAEPYERPKGGISRANFLPNLTVIPIHREGEATAEPFERPKGAVNPHKRPIHGVIPTRDHATIVFLTVCTKDRVKWLADPDVHDLLLNVWQDAQGWLVGQYVIMPDHIHLFAGWNGGKWSLETWCQFWKARFTIAHNNPSHEWQSGHWDTRMISYDQFVAKWEYVKSNPVRHGLVHHSDEWPYQGMLNEFGSW